MKITTAFSANEKDELRDAPKGVKDLEYSKTGAVDGNVSQDSVDKQSDIGLTQVWILLRLVLTNEFEGTQVSHYNCPLCNQVAQANIIECHECGEWFHFSCAGIEPLKVNSIPNESPYICLFCNDYLLNMENDQSDKFLTELKQVIQQRISRKTAPPPPPRKSAPGKLPPPPPEKNCPPRKLPPRKAAPPPPPQKTAPHNRCMIHLHFTKKKKKKKLFQLQRSTESCGAIPRLCCWSLGGLPRLCRVHSTD